MQVQLILLITKTGQHEKDAASHYSTNCSLNRFMRANQRRHLVTAKRTPGKVCTGIRNPRCYTAQQDIQNPMGIPVTHQDDTGQRGRNDQRNKK